MASSFSHFYKRDAQERLQIIADHSGLSDAQSAQLVSRAAQGDAKALIENYLTAFQLPEGVAVNFQINDHDYVVPMVTEEPSVIAAASNGAKTIADAGGIQAEVKSRLLMGQIVLSDVKVFASIDDWVALHTDELLEVARKAHPTIVSRGGGPRSIRTRDLGEGYVSIDLYADVKAAMGANMLNTMLEAMAEVIQTKLHHTTLFSILSNTADQSLATATCSIPVTALKNATQSGADVAVRIASASRVAQLDPYRAVTHNKGIMNGVDAVVIAMGNDWRAIEAAAHAFAVVDGQYRGLSTWTVQNDQLLGQLTLPLPVGTVGGATKVLPVVKINQQIATVKTPEDLMMIIVSVGLAQNFAALKALVTDGIQKGHMKMQLRSLALSAGATVNELKPMVAYLKTLSDPTAAAAETKLKELRTQIKDDNDAKH
ncbi:3-hydroxy-3-methylglutaryl-CoA reductase [Secundilactobacillus paracollinoides]|uniref:3-hydroxy-3-methylglutaryl coenzyme A reductase n=2 Tax=Secundilactobacillus paracollinoides TaxID=240427 RepID=A0A1B2IUT5_9LACO|nr:hydroxymethylglutaryl-CoA reductase, degradative [Secundilactobacillus paracollinoides]ANZ60014.1 3-hydroxy-3-methylglutaryl-CoA reductase [Secundilactobacillus paracollinoides]ANZ63030.1 3-hydroxy-3-methylglutaryl-CoA reductase [Secundilactobacillus paracollinoides]ANZ65807.1 3-hydroxy-3-methylglutaryl-CoA reductase [Secundilactobacillus paracollinoides]